MGIYQQTYVWTRPTSAFTPFWQCNKTLWAWSGLVSTSFGAELLVFHCILAAVPDLV